MKRQKHFAPSSKFDFHKYIKRSMEDDFKAVLGISIPLWMFSIIFLLLNVHGMLPSACILLLELTPHFVSSDLIILTILSQ
ncbi:hypothetical protein Hanom_Chr15g01414911 [Helianthus anomalus]